MKPTPFDPQALEELRERAKAQLRQRMRALRAAHPEAQRAERSRAVVERVKALPEFEAARSVALFWPLLDRQELDLRELDAALRAAGKLVYYPCLDASEEGALETGFGRVSATSELADRGRRFLEPPAGAPRAARGDVDLVITPALAIASSGHRLGYGSGFYDATLPDFCPPALSVAVAFDFQLLAELPASDHDVPCDVLVTDARVLRRARAETG
jgi:5-formyltetrahydrofolate cyclo-ligase